MSIGEASQAEPTRFVLSLFPAEPEPPFDAASEQELVWGRQWGAVDEVGKLEMVLLRRPGAEWGAVRGDTWVQEAESLVDPQRNWYWEARTPPDVGRMQAEHDGLAELLRSEGVDVRCIEDSRPELVNTVYTRDPLCVVRGGAIVGRLAPRMRRGEERYVAQTLSALGMPILRTIAGTGLMEGGTFVKLTPEVHAFGASIRCNQEGARQVAETLAPLGVELLVVPLCGWSIHLDGHITMLDVDKALVDVASLPYWFLDRLVELGIEPIPRLADEPWALNSLCLRPGRIVMSEGQPRTRELLESRGVEVLTIPYGEVQKGGGGIHCSTMELVRAPGR
jgi:N-dimethylarginine dimethylaminohydrolase